nr:MAG TPA: hypothetical protein [Caudoviricetes sp.]DAH46302.1 MAG TPA: hypothetical protein [Caudoviricetes sp.]DAJ49148.1 MAG TPA: hypothetical protein [Caudoviricetes sp.]DAJ81455.1 MAG TPA: hypothetical protein [Caudoviricetes sp.]
MIAQRLSSFESISFYHALYSASSAFLQIHGHSK